MKGIGRSDSVVLDPHKSLFLPYGTGSLLVRDRQTLKRTFSSPASYLPEMQSDSRMVDFCEISPELTRDFRGLRVYLPLKMLGIEAFRNSLDEKIDLARWIAQELKSIEGIELTAEPELSTLAFRLIRYGLDENRLNQLNQAFLQKINSFRRVFLTSTVLNGKFTLRICILSFRTHKKQMEIALEDIRRAAASMKDCVL